MLLVILLARMSLLRTRRLAHAEILRGKNCSNQRVVFHPVKHKSERRTPETLANAQTRAIQAPGQVCRMLVLSVCLSILGVEPTEPPTRTGMVGTKGLALGKCLGGIYRE